MERGNSWSACCLAKIISGPVFRGRHAILATVLVQLLVFSPTGAEAMTDKPTDAAEVPEKAGERPAEVKDRSEMADLKVVLRDSEGMPIVGALLYPYAMRVKEEQGHGYWNDEKVGPPTTVTSDEQGQAIVRYPAKIDVGAEIYTTILVTFLVKHTEFVQKVVHFDLGPPQADVTLDAGCEVQISAADEQGNPISPFAILMSGPYATDQWASDGQNGRRSRAVKDGKWQTILVSIPDDGPTLFSSVLPLPVRPKQAVKIRNARLSPGARVKGTLSSDVPRPVSNGRIIATALPKPAGSTYDEKDPSIAWHECTGIDENGNFELPSLPRGGEVQIIAICDGWLSKTTMEEARGTFTMGQLFPLDSLDVRPTIEMERTGTLEVTVKKPDGSPLEGAEVATWPNQLYYKGGSTILGQEHESRLSVLSQTNPPAPPKPSPRLSPTSNFSQKTDRNGKAILKGVPVGRNESLALMHPQYTLRTNEENRSREIRYNLPSAETQRIEVSAVEITASVPDGP